MTGDQRRPRGIRHFVSGTGAGYFSRAVTIVVGIATLPIAIDAYGPGVYGVWLTATSLALYLGNGALGMPLAVMTAVAGAPDREQVARIGGQGVRVAILGTAGLLAVGGLVGVLAPGWANGLFGAEATVPDVLLSVVLLLAVTALLQPLQVYANVQAGLHRIVARNLYDAVRTLGRFGALLIAVNASDSLLPLAIGTVTVEVVVGVVRAAHVSIAERVPIHQHVLRRAARHDGLVGSGLRFLALQIEATIIRNTDNIVISSLIGASAVSFYAAPLRLVTTATAIIESIQGPLWPAYGAAHRDGDWDWIAKMHGRVIGLGLTLGGAVWIGAVGFAAPVITLWLGPDFPVDALVVFALGAYSFITSWNTANAILLNALDATRSQMVAGAAEAIVNVGSSIGLGLVFGAPGVAAGTAIGAVCVSSWYVPRDVHDKTDGRVAPNFHHLIASTALTVPLATLSLWGAANLDGPTRWTVAVAASVVHILGCAFIFRGLVRGFREEQARRAAGVTVSPPGRPSE